MTSPGVCYIIPRDYTYQDYCGAKICPLTLELQQSSRGRRTTTNRRLVIAGDSSDHGWRSAAYCQSIPPCCCDYTQAPLPWNSTTRSRQECSKSKSNAIDGSLSYSILQGSPRYADRLRSLPPTPLSTRIPIFSVSFPSTSLIHFCIAASLLHRCFPSASLLPFCYADFFDIAASLRHCCLHFNLIASLPFKSACFPSNPLARRRSRDASTTDGPQSRR